MSLSDQYGMTTQESQDTPDASLADTQEDQDNSTPAAAAAGKSKKGKRKKPKAKLPIFTGLPQFLKYLCSLFVGFFDAGNGALCGGSPLFLTPAVLLLCMYRDIA